MANQNLDLNLELHPHQKAAIAKVLMAGATVTALDCPKGLGKGLALAIMDQAQPKPATSTDTGVRHPGNWPSSAVFAAEYREHDCQFPNVRHEPRVQYFDSQAELDQWFAEKTEWVVGTDNDFSVRYTVFEWDWGPVYKDSGTF